jgi:two-component system cell cycle response regulator DivK
VQTMSSAQKHNKTILIVDPNELNTRLYRDLLVARGHTVITTKLGGEAISLTRQHRPDLVLLEIYLLGDMLGTDLVRYFKGDAELKSVPVIAATASAMKGDEERLRECGFDAYIAIQISAAQFLEFVESFAI